MSKVKKLSNGNYSVKVGDVYYHLRRFGIYVEREANRPWIAVNTQTNAIEYWGSTRKALLDRLLSVKPPPTHFHSYMVMGVYNLNTQKSGYRVVGLWGDEQRGEGNRIGPTFSDDEFEACEQLATFLEEKYGLPVEITTIIDHFSEEHFRVS